MSQIDLTRNDDGGAVSVSVGDVLVVNLPEVPTTGYRWEPQLAGHGVLQLQSDEFIPSASGGIGGGGKRILRYLVREPGTAEMRFRLVRPWESDHGESVSFHIAAG